MEKMEYKTLKEVNESFASDLAAFIAKYTVEYERFGFTYSSSLKFVVSKLGKLFRRYS